MGTPCMSSDLLVEVFIGQNATAPNHSFSFFSNELDLLREITKL